MRTIFIRFLIVTILLMTLVAFAAKAKKPKKEKAKPIGEKPNISQIEPRGIQRGLETKIKLIGTNFLELTELKLSNPKLHGEIMEEEDEKMTEAWIHVTPEKDLARGVYDLSVLNEKGESAPVKLYVDDLPQVYETNKVAAVYPVKLPMTFWGALDPMGDSDEIEFAAKAGQNLVFDLAAKSIASKANTMITLFDDQGKPLASNNVFDGGDPLLTYKIRKNGRYKTRITEETLGGSPEHFYRLSIGELPEVVAVFPLSIATNSDARVELVGYNLSQESEAKFKAEKPGEIEVPVDLEKFRSRRTFKVLVSNGSEMIETEPNNLPSEAMKIKIPGAINGRIWPVAKGQSNDVDLFQFAAKKGQSWIIETMAMQRGSPVDTKIEILHSNGKPVERLLLQAVRDSHITFKAIDSATSDTRVENWEEMDLNQFLYMQGEIA
ncbi:MAG: c-type cytochrome domain-containing protein, partial [Limisphaerales bacterium]